MTDNTERRNRHSLRLKEYDYAHPGAYFVTLLTHNRGWPLGEIAESGITFSPSGKIVKETWDKIPRRFPNIYLDAFVVMPNHVHGIIIITDEGGGAGGCKGLINQTPTTQPQTTTPFDGNWIMMKNDVLVLGKIIRHFKAKTTKMIHDEGITAFRWQRNYYEHVVRSENELSRIRGYIVNNPVNWTTDELYCK